MTALFILFEEESPPQAPPKRAFSTECFNYYIDINA